MNIKYKKLGYFAISLFILLLSFVFNSNEAKAAKSITKTNLLQGINEINYQSSQLKESKVKIYKKLEKDLSEFTDKGSSNIKSTNMFYVLRENDFDASDYENAIKNTGLRGLGEAFKKAEEEYGVNGILLMAMAKHETGNGTSELFLNKNNLFGFNAYDYDPYNQASKFDSPADSINTVAKHLADNYLDSEGAYYNGMSTDGIGVDYATDPDWSKKVNWMMIEVGQNMIDEFNLKTSR